MVLGSQWSPPFLVVNVQTFFDFSILVSFVSSPRRIKIAYGRPDRHRQHARRWQIWRIIGWGAAWRVRARFGGGDRRGRSTGRGWGPDRTRKSRCDLKFCTERSGAGRGHRSPVGNAEARPVSLAPTPTRPHPLSPSFLSSPVLGQYGYGQKGQSAAGGGGGAAGGGGGGGGLRTTRPVDAVVLRGPLQIASRQKHILEVPK
ncbi:hypothetical protein NL676_024800 [Syzygium grande]|nr:hypothetical protein NL676_024800 [Syzygium grande]